MGIIRNELKKQISQNNASQAKLTTGKILEYDHISNVAKVRYMNQQGNGYFTRENVRIACMDGGVNTSAIHAGQECIIEFANGNIFSPVIVGLTESLYSTRTCSDQGAFLPSNNLRSYTKPTKISPMIEDWIDLENNNTVKYNNEIIDYRDVDIIKEVHNMLIDIDKYSSTEIGITHTNNKSTIKVKDNGDIDIFAANNLGIRISPSSRSIDIYGVLKINGKEVDIE